MSEKIILKDLKDLVYKNEKDLYEFKLDPKDILLLGSISSVQDKPTVFTSYKFKLNKYKVFEEAFQICL